MGIRVLVNGAFGRMGQMTTAAIQEHPHLELVGQTGREYDLGSAIQDSRAQVVIDFTHPDVVFNNTLAILEAGARPVIGTTGLKEEQVALLQEKAAYLQIGGLIAPNFSLGAVLMMKYAKEIAKYMPHVEIIEMHHEGKAETPSGTAMRTAELIMEGLEEINEPEFDYKEIIPGSRGALHKGIPIHAIRLPGLLAHQSVIFGEPGETLTIKHDSIDRRCFAPGICFACEKVMDLNELVYGLENIL